MNMLKKNKNQIIASTLAVLLPTLIGLLLWSRLPEKMPIHWNMEGEVDGYSSRAMAVFGVPGIILAAHVVCVLCTAIDPKHQNVTGKMLTLVYWICPVIGLVAGCACYAAAMGAELHVEVLILALVGLLFVVIGNYLPKCQPNYTVGIKLPWTLHSEDNWRKTHRMAGPVWIAGGLVMILGAFLGKWGFAISMIMVALLVLIPTVYSYLLYRRGEQSSKGL